MFVNCPQVGKDEVCYASFDLLSRGQKCLKKRNESSEFSLYSEVTYSEIKTDKM